MTESQAQAGSRPGWRPANGLAGVGPEGHNAAMAARARGRSWLLSGDFGRFWLGQTISNLGSSFTFFALPLLVFKLTGSPINLGVTTAAEFVPYLLFGLVIGGMGGPGRPQAPDGRHRPGPGGGDRHRPAAGRR